MNTRELGVMYFLLLAFLVIVGFYVGFSWDVLAFAGAASRVARELITGVGAKDVTMPGSSQTGTTVLASYRQSTGATVTTL